MIRQTKMVKPLWHERLWSRSTTASSSPITSEGQELFTRPAQNAAGRVVVNGGRPALPLAKPAAPLASGQGIFRPPALSITIANPRLELAKSKACAAGELREELRSGAVNRASTMSKALLARKVPSASGRRKGGVESRKTYDDAKLAKPKPKSQGLPAAFLSAPQTSGTPMTTTSTSTKPVAVAKRVKPRLHDCARAKTPVVGALATSTPAAAKLLRTPGGTDYIITPGRHRIEMNEFLAGFDIDISLNGCPRMRGTVHYAENMHRCWLQAEKLIDNRVFMLSFADDCPMERFRQMAVQSVFNYAVEHRLHQNTVHLTCLNISRLIHGRILNSREKLLTHELFSITVIAALRNAIKMDESFEKTEKFRLDPEHVWRSSGFLANACPGRTVKALNDCENECLMMLEKPSNPPVAPEFLERYIAVGTWPMYKESYQELASFLLGMSLFASGGQNPLRGIASSKLAAAALVLAVKIINTDGSEGCKWEFWPERLVEYTGYDLNSLKPVIRGIAYLLRNKPASSHVLERFYVKWGAFDWN